MKYTNHRTDDPGACEATFNVTLASLLAAAEVPCTSGCKKGSIDNSAAVDVWRAEHADKIEAFREDRRRRRSATLSAEESALMRTEPYRWLACGCDGTGVVLTDDGRALLAFLDRHRPLDHYHADGWA